MTLAKMKTLSVLVFVCCLLAGVGGAAKEPDRTQATQADRRDCHGDPLPPDAIARFGTTRFRHGFHVFDIAFTPDGKRVLSADWYGAHLWETATGLEIHRFGFRFQTSLRSVSLSPDGKTMALAEHRSGTIQILETATGKLLHQFVNGPNHEDRFCSAVFSPDGKFLASQAGKIIRLWDPATVKQLRQWQADPESVHRIVFTPDGKTLISGGEDKTIRLWDTSTGKELRRITDHPGPITGLALSPDGKTLASQGSTKHESNVPGGGKGILWLTDNKIHLWDTSSGNKLRHLEAVGAAPKKDKPSIFHPNAIHSFVFAPDGKTLVTAGDDRTVRFWDVNQGKELRRWENHWVNALAFSRDGKILAAGMNSSVRLWDAATGRELYEQAGHSSGVLFLALSPDGRRVATASPDATVRIWDAASGREMHRLRSPDGEMAPVAFSADGRTLTTVGIDLTSGGGGKKGRVWDVATGKEIRQLPGWDKCSSYAVSADGRTYAFIGKDKQAWLWDAVAERKRPVRIEHSKEILKLALSAYARTLFGWCGDQKIHCWDAVTGKELRQFDAGTGRDTNCVTFSPDGRWFAWAGRDLEIRLYDLDTGKEVRRLMAIYHFISSLAFAPDGRTLAGSSMNDPTIFLWETASGQVRHRLKGHEGRIFTLVFSSNSKHLLSGSEDTTALLWDPTGASGERGRANAPSLRTRWEELASTDAETAYRMLRCLTAAPGPTVDFLRKQLQSIPEPDPKHVARLIADLDHDEFARRESAEKELEKLGEAIELTLQATIADTKSAELRRRAEAVLARLPDAERRTPSAARLRMLRSIEVLERIGTAEARQLLRKLAGGAAGARLTREAKQSLERLSASQSER